MEADYIVGMTHVILETSQASKDLSSSSRLMVMIQMSAVGTFSTHLNVLASGCL